MANNAELNFGFEWGYFDTTTGAVQKVTDKIVSRHSGSVNVAFCDGHQTTLSDSVDLEVFKHLMTPWGTGCPTTNGNQARPTGILDEGSF